METCYRHPNRETGVSCQRCDRFICPECATPGAVGFLCPEDAGDRVKIQRANFQKSLFQRAPITMTLIGINVLVFIAQFLIPDSQNIFAFAPDYVGMGGLQHALLLALLTQHHSTHTSSSTCIHYLFWGHCSNPCLANLNS